MGNDLSRTVIAVGHALEQVQGQNSNDAANPAAAAVPAPAPMPAPTPMPNAWSFPPPPPVHVHMAPPATTTDPGAAPSGSVPHTAPDETDPEGRYLRRCLKCNRISYLRNNMCMNESCEPTLQFCIFWIVYIYICTYTCVCIHIYIYIYIFFLLFRL